MPLLLDDPFVVLSDWLAHGDRFGLQGGVIVQVSFLGVVNTELCAALAKLDRRRFAGVAVVPLDVADVELDQLIAAGVRGLRWNLVRGAAIPNLKDRTVRSFLARIYARDLHLEIHLESPCLAPLLGPLLGFGGNVVIDHFGLPSEPDPKDDPWLRAVERTADLSNLYIKFSGCYRSAFDVRPHAQALLSMLPSDHIVWGSDWPHTQHEAHVDYDLVAGKRMNWGLDTDLAAAKVLYGIAMK